MAAPVALLFPGQGAQAVGMGVALAENFPAVARWYAEAEAAADLPLRSLLRDGPDDRLRETEILQPALLTVEIGAWIAWRELVPNPPVAALGHSLGEYAALVAAGALDAATAVALVRRRGRYMREAVPSGVGGMSAVMGLDAAAVAQACERASDTTAQVWLSNDNSPGQVVISGHLAAIERATRLLKDAGARRVVPLNVSAPFHCPLMEPAAARLADDLIGVPFAAPAFPVIANHSAQPYAGKDVVAAGLHRQVVAPVRFRESLLVAAGFAPARLIELGPGTVLSGLAKRTLPEVPAAQADAPEALRHLAAEVA